MTTTEQEAMQARLQALDAAIGEAEGRRDEAVARNRRLKETMAAGDAAPRRAMAVAIATVVLCWALPLTDMLYGGVAGTLQALGQVATFFGAYLGWQILGRPLESYGGVAAKFVVLFFIRLLPAIPLDLGLWLLAALGAAEGAVLFVVAQKGVDRGATR